MGRSADQWACDLSVPEASQSLTIPPDVAFLPGVSAILSHLGLPRCG